MIRFLRENMTMKFTIRNNLKNRPFWAVFAFYNKKKASLDLREAFLNF